MTKTDSFAPVGDEAVTILTSSISVLEDQGKHNTSDSQRGLWCICGRLTDMHGSYFSDNMPAELGTLWNNSMNCKQII